MTHLDKQINKGLRRAKHETTAAYQQRKVEQSSLLDTVNCSLCYGHLSCFTIPVLNMSFG